MKRTQLCELHTDYESGVIKKLSGIEWEYNDDRLVFLQSATRYGKQFLNITAKENDIDSHYTITIFHTAMTGTGKLDLADEFIYMEKGNYKSHEPRGYLFFALWEKNGFKKKS